MERYSALHEDSSDAGYFYNERPNISFLAAGAWMAGWGALEEYVSEKFRAGAKGSGRTDLYLVNTDGHAVIEAKHVWMTSKASGGGLRNTVKRSIKRAVADARAIRNVDAKFGCVFFVPYFSIKKHSRDLKNYNDAIRSYIERCTSVPGVDMWAWSFPKPNRRQEAGKDNKNYYPGVLIGFKGVKYWG